jgi:predicted CoA-substrate-specific enzyme activase
LVTIEIPGGTVVSSVRIETTSRLASDCRRLLKDTPFDRLVVTGYGRAMAEVEFDVPTVTEIKAFAHGAHALRPGCRTVLDIGGQDTKAIALDGRGNPTKFEMNDRCAAGAGRLLEMMAAALGYDLCEFGRASLEGAKGSDETQLSSMCAVFAESEAVGLLTRGRSREGIARAVHRAILKRTVAMLERVSAEPPVVFAGGAARNPCLVAMVNESLGLEVFVPDDPQMVGAYGAALVAADRMRPRDAEVSRV